MPRRPVDPTRTYTLRRGVVAQTRARFARLRRSINQLVITEDAFGLKGPTTNKRWRFLTLAAKIQAFQKWLKEQTDALILGPEDGNTPAPWLAKYITSAYRQGRVNAYTAAKPDLGATTEFMSGTRAAFLQGAFSLPVQTAKIQLLATRAYSGLKAVTAIMDAEMSRVLADGMANGHGVQKIARSLVKVVDGLEKKRALRIARTEVMHAHAEGQLDSFEDLGIEEVGIMAEWSTAGDAGVCKICAPLEGAIFTIAQARGLIPRHVDCRCSWIPFIKPRKPGHYIPDNRSRVRLSVRAERVKGDFKEVRDKSKWVGADLVTTTNARRMTAAKARAKLKRHALRHKHRTPADDAIRAATCLRR